MGGRAEDEDLVVVDDHDDDGFDLEKLPAEDDGGVAATVKKLRETSAGVPVGSKPAPPKVTALVERQHSFALDFRDTRGRRWHGDFTSHVLSVRERIQVGALRAQLLAGAPSSAVDEFTSDLVE